MKSAWLGCLLWGTLLTAGNQLPETNVNSRYTVESVQLMGEAESRISSGLREEMTRLIGENLNPALLDQLADRIRKELSVTSVTHRVLRGTQPQHVKVIFDVKGRIAKFELSVPKFLYHSTEGWNGIVEGTATVGANRFTMGLVSDADVSAERYTGMIARYENRNVGTERLRFRFQYEAYHEQWNPATQQALAERPQVPGIYRTRQNVEPVATVVIAQPLTLSVGASFQTLQTQFPAARTEAANALVSTLRYHRVIEASNANQYDLDAGYNLRAATSLLDSDFAYLRHAWEVRWALSHGKHLVTDHFTAGLISGRAPLFERFVLGNATTLRGWNKFDIDPLGASRMAHNSVEYRYGILEVFYDTGAIWEKGQSAPVRHSAGIGLRQGIFSLAIAFPLREGRIDPVFMVGMNY